jgi:hypothetical protein
MDNFDFKRLRESFTYFPETGKLFRNSNKKFTNSLDVHGYIQVGYMKKIYKAHRLIWAIVHGEFPKGQIDHINNIRHDNRIDNLRDVTQQQNANNKKEKFKTNTSGYKGVCWNKRSKKWQSCISVNNKTIYLGVFEDAELAHKAYLNAKKAYHHIT